jgi:hypothetical protein
LAANNTATPTKKQVSIPPVAYVIAAVLVIGLGAFLYLEREAGKPAPAPPPLTGAAKDYAKYLRFVSADGQQLQNPTMTAHESYVKQSVVEITGNIMNAGDRVLQLVEIVCIFYDPYGHELLRERVPIVSQKMGKLAPGEVKPFRLAFDSVPEEWNQAMPQMVIARIEFS